MPKDKDRLRLVIFSPNSDVTSETFIRAHIERLPFTILPRYGLELGIGNEKGNSVWPGGWWIGLLLGRKAPKLNRQILTFLLARHLRAIRADAVLAEYGVTGSWVAPACERAGVPVFVHFHGFDASVSDVLTEHGEDYQNIFRMAAGVVAVSNVMYERLLAMGAPEERLHLNPCGVDSDGFSGGVLSDKPPAFFAVGRFVEKKAPHLTILAFRRVLQEVPEATLTIVGDGPLLGPCKRMIQALHIEKSVKLLGSREHEVVRSEMRQSRAFVQHSLVADNGDSEGTPVAIIEAQMTGIPVVATRHAGIPDVVIDGETGFLVDETDVDEMAAAIIKLAKDGDLAHRMGNAARKHALLHFSLEQHISHLALMIEEAVYKRSWAYACS